MVDTGQQTVAAVFPAVDERPIDRSNCGDMSTGWSGSRTITKTVDDLSVIRQLAKIATSDKPTNSITQSVAAVLQRQYDWDYVGIFFVDQVGRRIVPQAFATENSVSSGQERSFDQELAESVASSKTHCLIEHVDRDGEDVTGEVDIRHHLWLPVICCEEVVAVLHIGADDADKLRSQLPLLETVADILAGAVATSRRITVMQIMSEVARLAVESCELPEMLQRTVDYISEQLRVTVASILMLNSEGTHFAYEVIAGELELEPLDDKPITVGVTGRCVRSGEPQLVTDVEEDDDYVPGHPSVKAEYLVPIAYADSTIGVLNLESENRDVFTDEAQRVFRGIAMQIAGAIHLLGAKGELQKKNTKITRLLQNILPDHAVTELGQRGKVAPRYAREATVVFTDFTGFTLSARWLAAEQLLEALHEYFTEFDGVVEHFGLEKIKTIGDSYMCVAGVPHCDGSNVVDAVLAACMFRDVTRARSSARGLGWDIRIGIHSGPLISGVIGTRKLTYDVWGSTVNLASRVQTAGSPGEVTISEHSIVQARDFFETRDMGKTKTKEGIEIGISEIVGPRPELREDGAFARRYTMYYEKEFPGFPELGGERPIA